MQYEYQCQGSDKESGNVTGQPLFIIKAQTGECSINIFSSSSIFKVEGTIEVHPLERAVPINLDKQKVLIETVVLFGEKFPSLVYSISNLVADTEAKFISGTTTVTFDGKTFTPKNPFRICVENDCKDDIETYKFIKGKEYTIEIKPEELDSGTRVIYCMNSFSFYKTSGGGDGDDTSDTSAGNNFSVNPLIYLIVILLLFNELLN